MQRVPRPQILTITLVTALTLLLPVLARSEAGHEAGHAHHSDAVVDHGVRPGHVHEGAVVPVADVAPPRLPRTGWTVVADSQETVGENAPASNVLDGSIYTFWHSKWYNGVDPLPQTLTVDMKALFTVAGLQYLPRTDGVANGRIGQYRVEVSTNGTTWGAPVATGTFADDATEKTAAFGGVTARYVRLTALTEAGNRGQFMSAAEINVLGTAGGTTTAPPTTTVVVPPTTTTATVPPTTTVPPPTTTSAPVPALLTRTGWTVAADSQETVGENAPASNVLDGSNASFWHSKWYNGVDPLPQTLTVDMKATFTLTSLRYLPRTDGVANGRIGQYRVEMSADGTTWGTPVATGTFADSAAEKAATFTAATAGRYVRLTSLSEAGNRGQFASAAEINVVGYAGGTPPTTTVPPPTTTGTTPPGTTTVTTPPTTTAPPTTTTPPPTPALLTRTGWTATADSQEVVGQNAPASNALDGNAGTFWHTKWYNGAEALPHTLTVDMKATFTVTALRYLPRADGVTNGRIGQYRVEVSADGTAWGTPVATGTFVDSAAEKTATFTSATAGRYVRLTALGEAGNRGPWTSAAEINLIGYAGGTTTQPPTTVGSTTATTAPPTTTTPPSTGVGRWDAPTGFPIVPVAAAMLPTGKVLTWSAYQPDNFGGSHGLTQTATLDLASGAVSQRTVSNTGHDMFCPGTAMLPDGRLLVNGGSDSDKTSIYDPSSNGWSTSSPLATPRGYQTAVTLSDGQVFTIGGSWSGGSGGKDGEIWSPTSGSRSLPNALVGPALTADPTGAFRADNHMWLFTWTNNRVFQAGPSKAMNWYGMAGNGSTTAAGNRSDDTDAMNGNAVMYEPGKILAVGGSPAYDNSYATANAYTIDITGAAVSVRKLAPMANARAFGNGVVLPDGKVLVVGGQNYAVPFSDATSVMTPELWDPATGAFTPMTSMAIPRNYHSVALLLPDGRVLSGGGGLCGTCTTNHFDAEIFTPPYLLNADGTAKPRPAITAAPTAATAGGTISVTTDRAVTAYSLVRMGSATHTVDTDQRRIPLTSSGGTGTTATLAVPADRGVVVPGYYMLFALDAAGVPSVAKIVKVS